MNTNNSLPTRTFPTDSLLMGHCLPPFSLLLFLNFYTHNSLNASLSQEFLHLGLKPNNRSVCLVHSNTKKHPKKQFPVVLFVFLLVFSTTPEKQAQNNPVSCQLLRQQCTIRCHVTICRPAGRPGFDGCDLLALTQDHARR